MPGPDRANTPDAVLVRVDRPSDADLVVYGLKLRCIPALIRSVPRRPEQREVLVTREALPAAHAALPYIWDGLRGRPADAVLTHCPACGYDLAGLARGTRCPECGLVPFAPPPLPATPPTQPSQEHDA